MEKVASYYGFNCDNAASGFPTSQEIYPTAHHDIDVSDSIPPDYKSSIETSECDDETETENEVELEKPQEEESVHYGGSDESDSDVEKDPQSHTSPKIAREKRKEK